jgi:SEC-C motif-containing protein
VPLAFLATTRYFPGIVASPAHHPVGRNDPCPCGSGKKYKRCCLEKIQDSADNLWARERAASDELTGLMVRYAARKLGPQIDDAWADFELDDGVDPFEPGCEESAIFLPYLLYHWDPYGPRRRKGVPAKGGMIARWYLQEEGKRHSDTQRHILEQATTQPISFYEILASVPGSSLTLRDILTGWEISVMEKLASEGVRPGDILYAQIWVSPGLATLGCAAPLLIPPKWKAEIIALRKKLRKKVAKQNRDLAADDLLRYADEIRETYLDIRDTLYAPPILANTDEEPLVFHTLKFQIESAEAALDALAPLAWGREKEDLLEDAEFDGNGKLRKVCFDWLTKGNRKMPTWDNTILGNLTISGRTLVAEVNSEKRAVRLRAEIEKRLGSLAVHKSTSMKPVEELLANPPKRKVSAKKFEEEEAEILRDPEVKKHLQESLQKMIESWVHQKIAALGNRTPAQAVQDPDGKEIVEALLLEWERTADDGRLSGCIRPDMKAVRKLLNLPSPPS